MFSSNKQGDTRKTIILKTFNKTQVFPPTNKKAGKDVTFGILWFNVKYRIVLQNVFMIMLNMIEFGSNGYDLNYF